MRFKNLLVTILWAVVFGTVNSKNGAEKFTEELYIKPLTNGDLLAHFSFDITSSRNLLQAKSKSSKDELTQFDLMPKVVGEFLTDHSLEGKSYVLYQLHSLSNVIPRY